MPWTNKHQKQAKCLSVVTLYIMFHGQSQLCNWLQKDLAVFSHTHGLSDMGLDTMGLSVSRETLHQFVKQAAALHQRHINSSLQEAINKEKCISLLVDDYTIVHTFRQPTSGKSVDVAHMATVLVRIFDEPAIPAEGHSPINDPAGININSLTTKFNQKITDILKPFIQTAPYEIHAQFFTQRGRG